MDPQELRRQVRSHLDSLRRAGVEWLPAAPAVNVSWEPTGTAESKAEAAVPLDAQGRASEEEPSPDLGLSLENRRQALEVLAKEVSACTRCAELASTRTQTVFGAGHPGVDLCFVGEAPGADEDAQGIPFVGAAGNLLNRIIAACGLERAEVYICNVIKCRPPGNRTPLPHECGNCRSYLERQLELIAPKYICALGGSASQNLLGSTVPLGKLRGRFHDFKGIPVICTYHPGYLLPHRAPEKKREVWEDMQMLMKRMGRQIPSRTMP